MSRSTRGLSSILFALALTTGCLCSSEDSEKQSPAAVTTPEAARAYLLGEWRGKGAVSDEAPAFVHVLVRSMRLTVTTEELFLKVGRGEDVREQRHPYTVLAAKDAKVEIESVHAAGKRRKQVIEIVDRNTIHFQKHGSDFRAILERVR